MKNLQDIFWGVLNMVPEKFLLQAAQFFSKILAFKYAAFFLVAYLEKTYSSRQENLQIHSGEKNFLSLIIPTYNRGRSLERLLLALQDQNLPQVNYEIIIVNNACTDETQRICEAFLSKFKNFKIIYEPTAGLLAARNSGVLAAKGEILTFCDDDIEPYPIWLSAIMDIMVSHPDIMLLGGNNKGAFDILPPAFVNEFWIQDEHGIQLNFYYSLIENINQSMPAPHQSYIMGCNFTTRRSVLDIAQGFGPDCMPNIIWQGDGENRVGKIAEKMGKVWLDPKVSVRHWMSSSRLTREYVEKRKLYSDIVESYTSLREFNFSIYKNGDNPHKNKNRYLQLALNYKELRDWIMLENYLMKDPPYIKDIKNHLFLQRHGW